MYILLNKWALFHCLKDEKTENRENIKLSFSTQPNQLKIADFCVSMLSMDSSEALEIKCKSGIVFFNNATNTGIPKL